MPKSLLQRIGDVLGGAEQAAKNKEEAARQAAEAARRAAEAHSAEAKRWLAEQEGQAPAEVEATAAEAQRQQELQAQADQEARLHRELEEAVRGLRAEAKAARTYVVQSGDTLIAFCTWIWYKWMVPHSLWSVVTGTQ